MKMGIDPGKGDSWSVAPPAAWFKERGYHPEDGCEDYYNHSCEQATRMMERLEELGAVHVFASPDLVHMFICAKHSSAMSAGFVLICDKTLPPNSLIDATARRLNRV